MAENIDYRRHNEIILDNCYEIYDKDGYDCGHLPFDNGTQYLKKFAGSYISTCCGNWFWISCGETTTICCGAEGCILMAACA